VVAKATYFLESIWHKLILVDIMKWRFYFYFLIKSLMIEVIKAVGLFYFSNVLNGFGY
jgi:hypothetical protein